MRVRGREQVARIANCKRASHDSLRAIDPASRRRRRGGIVMHDAFGNIVHCSSVAAVQAYDRAVDRYLHAFPGVLEATEEALAHDAGFALAYTLRGLFHAAYGRGDEARQCLSQARDCIEGA